VELTGRLEDREYYHDADPVRRRLVEDVGVAAGNLAIDYDEMCQFGRSARLHELVVALEERTVGADSLRMASELANLACSYSESDDPDEQRRSVPLLRRALQIEERHLGRSHPRLVVTLQNIGTLLADEDPSGAAPFLTRALALAEESYGHEHPQVSSVLQHLGDLHLSREEYTDAERCHRDALAIADRVLGPVNAAVAQRASALAATLVKLGREREGLEQYERALSIQERTLGEDHLALATSLLNVAFHRTLQLQVGGAISAWCRAVRILWRRKHYKLVATCMSWPVLSVFAILEGIGKRLAEGQDRRARP
jgi:tetratricopeptide (TPR) repeat protein